MASIGLAIGDIVDQVDDPGQRAKHPEPCRRVEDRVRIEEALPEEQAAEDDEILRPLPRTERSNEVPDNGPRDRTQLALARLGLIEMSGILCRAIYSAAGMYAAWLTAEALDGIRLGLVRLEHGQQLRDGEQDPECVS